MKCPKCGADYDHVIQSRWKGEAKSRRRECLSCGHRWNTVERVGGYINPDPEENYRLRGLVEL